MATVVLHPGAGKAGSSSIQDWLARNVDRLRDAGICLLAAEPASPDEAPRSRRLVAYESGSANANSFFPQGSSRREQYELIEAFFEQVDTAARRSRLTVVSAEAMAILLSPVDECLVEQLNRLARTHEVRMPYYVRPQHTALEAWWRQWGFRDGRSPSRYIREHAHALRYFDTYVAMRELAPDVSFEPRPFRRDLLDWGDPAADFARRFLDVADAGCERLPVWSNRGLPLEMVNALRCAPPGALWSSLEDNDRLDRLKELLPDLDTPEAAETKRSRCLLQAYCHRTFEAGNARLVEALGWNIESFVPPAAEEGEADLAELDELWRPKVAEAALESIYAALGHAISSTLDTEQALAAVAGVLDPTYRDVQRVAFELERLRASRSWRWSRRLIEAASALRRGSQSEDPTKAMLERLDGAAQRLGRLESSWSVEVPPRATRGR